MESSLKPDVNSVTFIIWSAHSPRNMILVGRSWLWPTGLPSTSGLSMPDLCWRYYFEDWGEGGEGSPGIRWRPPPGDQNVGFFYLWTPPLLPVPCTTARIPTPSLRMGGGFRGLPDAYNLWLAWTSNPAVHPASSRTFNRRPSSTPTPPPSHSQLDYIVAWL